MRRRRLVLLTFALFGAASCGDDCAPEDSRAHEIVGEWEGETNSGKHLVTIKADGTWEQTLWPDYVIPAGVAVPYYDGTWEWDGEIVTFVSGVDYSKDPRTRGQRPDTATMRYADGKLRLNSFTLLFGASAELRKSRILAPRYEGERLWVWISRLGGDHGPTSPEAIRLINSLGVRPLKVLLDVLVHSTDSMQRIRVARLIAISGAEAPEITPVLVHIAKTSPEEVRNAILDAIAGIKDRIEGRIQWKPVSPEADLQIWRESWPAHEAEFLPPTVATDTSK